MPDSEYKVNIVVQTTDKTSGPAKQAAKGLGGLKDAAKLVAAGFAAIKSAQFVAELTKMGAASQRQSTALDNLAAAAGTSGNAIIRAIEVASDFTIDKMSAMQIANRAMVLDVAKSPAEFERLTKVAVALGRAMGVDATTSIDNFVTAAGRQSRLIADNLGLMVDATTANERYAQANGIAADAVDDAGKKQAFLQEMLRQGEAKLRDLGVQTLDNAGKMEQAGAAWKNAKTSLGEMLATIANTTGVLDRMGQWTRNVSMALDTLNEEGFNFRAWLQSVGTYMTTYGTTTERSAKAIEQYAENVKVLNEADAEWVRQNEILLNSSFGIATATDEVTQSLRELNPEIDRYAHTLEKTGEIERYAHTTDLPQLERKYHELADGVDEVRYVSEGYAKALQTGVKANYQIEDTIRETAEALEEEAKAAREAEVALAEAAKTATQTGFALAAALSGQFRDVGSATAEFNANLRDEEARHQGALAELRKRGATRTVAFDAAAEDAKLAKLRERLQLATMEQEAFTDKTAEATRLRKQYAIRDLEAEIVAQNQLLTDYHEGRLVRTGENVTQLIAEEERLHEAKTQALQEEMAAEREARKEAIGAKVAETAVSELDKALAADQITLDQYRTAVGEVQLAFGLTDEASLNMANSVLRLVEGLTSGRVSAEGFNEALSEQVSIYDSELLQLEKFGKLLSDAYEPMVAVTAEDYALTEQTKLMAEAMVSSDEATLGAQQALSEFEQQSRWARKQAEEFSTALRTMPSEKTVTITTIYRTRGEEIPALQYGGRAIAGRPYLVGERGAELFVPDSTGSVVDSHDTYNLYTQQAAALALTGRRRRYIGRRM